MFRVSVLCCCSATARAPNEMYNLEYPSHSFHSFIEKSVGTSEFHYSTKKRQHFLDILKSCFRQSMKRRIATER